MSYTTFVKRKDNHYRYYFISKLNIVKIFGLLSKSDAVDNQPLS